MEIIWSSYCATPLYSPKQSANQMKDNVSGNTTFIHPEDTK